MLRLEVIFCLLFVNNCRGSAYFLTCPEVTQDTASCESVESWLCGSSDWLGSMVDWKDTVEEVCSKEDLGAQWEELFSCPDTVTVECVNETATSCGNDPFNCTICYCHDGKYKDRQNYLRLWKKHQEIFRKSMMFYKEKIKFCGQRTACTETDEVTTTMETTDTTQQLPTDNTTTTDTTTIKTTTVASTTIETTTEDQGEMTSRSTSGSSKTTESPHQAATSTNTRTESTTTSIGDSCTNEMIYDNKCFIVVIDRYVNYDDGVAICGSRGGHLANIYSQTHMYDVMKYIRENRLGIWTGLAFRLGMKYDPKADKLTLRDGTDAPAGLKWHPSYPEGSADYTSVLLIVQSDQSSIYQYLSNGPLYSRYYAVCEIE